MALYKTLHAAHCTLHTAHCRHTAHCTPAPCTPGPLPVTGFRLPSHPRPGGSSLRVGGGRQPYYKWILRKKHNNLFRLAPDTQITHEAAVLSQKKTICKTRGQGGGWGGE